MNPKKAELGSDSEDDRVCDYHSDDFEIAVGKSYKKSVGGDVKYKSYHRLHITEQTRSAKVKDKSLLVWFDDATKSFDDCWTELNCAGKDALAVAQNVDVARNVKVDKEMKTVALLFREKPRPVESEKHETWKLELPSKGEKEIEAAKVEAMRKFDALKCGALFKNFSIRGIERNPEKIMEFCAGMDEKTYNYRFNMAVMRKSQGIKLDAIDSALVNKDGKKQIDIERNDVVGNAVRLAVRGGHGQAIRWGRGCWEERGKPDGVNDGMELCHTHPVKGIGRCGRTDFDTSSLTYSLLKYSGEVITLTSLTDAKVESHVKYATDYAQAICGLGDIGKTQLSRAKAHEFCTDKKPYYISVEGSGCIEELKILSKSYPGLLENAAAIVAADFQLLSSRCTLDLNDAKAVFATKRNGTIGGTRNRGFTLPEFVPRFFSFNQPFVNIVGIPAAIEASKSPQAPPRKRRRKESEHSPAGSSTDGSSTEAPPLTNVQLLNFLKTDAAHDYRPLFFNTSIAGMTEEDIVRSKLITAAALKEYEQKLDEENKKHIDRLKARYERLDGQVPGETPVASSESKASTA